MGDTMEPLPTPAYAQARKEGKSFRLYYRGTTNEVFPGELFQSAAEARRYLEVMRVKQG